MATTFEELFETPTRVEEAYNGQCTSKTVRAVRLDLRARTAYVHCVTAVLDSANKYNYLRAGLLTEERKTVPREVHLALQGFPLD